MTTVDLKSLLGDDILAFRDGNPVRVPVSILQGKTVGLYFSASWCPPCRSFTPMLCSTYEKLQEAKKPFEVVFVSGDSDESKFMEYWTQHMPWCAVPFSDSSRRKALNRHFGVAGIPTLIIIGPDGQVLNRNARMAVLQDRTGENFPWEGQEEPRQFSPWVTILAILVIWIIFKLFMDK